MLVPALYAVTQQTEYQELPTIHAISERKKERIERDRKDK